MRWGRSKRCECYLDVADELDAHARGAICSLPVRSLYIIDSLWYNAMLFPAACALPPFRRAYDVANALLTSVAVMLVFRCLCCCYCYLQRYECVVECLMSAVRCCFLADTPCHGGSTMHLCKSSAGEHSKLVRPALTMGFASLQGRACISRETVR